MEYSIKEKDLFFEGKIIQSFITKITHLLVFSDLAIVILDYYSYNQDNENVFGVNNEGEIIWQIEGYPHVYEHSPFVDISQNADKLVTAFNWDGSRIIINPMTGRIVEGPIEGR